MAVLAPLLAAAYNKSPGSDRHRARDPPATGQHAGGMEFRAGRSASGNVTGEVFVMVRSENIRLRTTRPENVPPGTTILDGSIRNVIDFGPIVKVRVAHGPEVELLVSLGRREYKECRVDIGHRVFLTIDGEDLHVMNQ